MVSLRITHQKQNKIWLFKLKELQFGFTDLLMMLSVFFKYVDWNFQIDKQLNFEEKLTRIEIIE